MLDFIVLGVPVPQGSMTARINHNTTPPTAYLHSSNDKVLKEWRRTIKRGAENYLQENPAPLISSACKAVVLFEFERPASRKGGWVWVDTYPDLDKLLRAVFDALTGTLIKDDKLIVDVRAQKRYSDRSLCRIQLEEMVHGVWT